MLYRPETGHMWDPSIFVWNGEYHMLSMHYASEGAPGTGMWLAKSKDGVHWTGVGRVLEDEKGLFKMYVSLAEDGALFLNYGSSSDGDPDHNDTLRYAVSKDMVHWQATGENHPDGRWYNPDGRWDHMYVYHEGTEYYGYPVSTPRPELRSCIGLQKSKDGVHWECCRPPRVEWGDVPPIDCLEVGGMEKIGDTYYFIAGYVGYAGSSTYNVYVFRSDSPEGPFYPDTEAFRLCGADGFEGKVFVSNLGCFFRENGEVLLSNAISAPGGDEVWLLPVRTVIRDEGGHLRLGWWKKNEALRGEDIPHTARAAFGEVEPDAGEDSVRVVMNVPDAPMITDRFAKVVLVENVGFEEGLYLTGSFVCRSAPPRHDDIHKTHCWRPARVGFSMGTRDGHDMAIMLDAGPAYRRKSHVWDVEWREKPRISVSDEMGEDYAGVKGVSCGETHTFRLLVRRNMMELYVDDLLVQAWASDETPTGEVSLILQNASCTLTDLRACRMDLA